MDKLFNLAHCVKFMKSDAEKFFEKNNHAAGVRLRKKLQKCKKISHHIRKLVQYVKSKYIQKKNKSKAECAAFLGKTILDDKKFQLDCLSGRDLINIESQTFEKYFFKKTTDELEFEKNIPNKYDFDRLFNLENIIPNKYDFDRLFNLENILPIPNYSFFNYNC